MPHRCCFPPKNALLLQYLMTLIISCCAFVRSDLPTDLAVAAAQSWDPHSTQPALKASSDRSSRGLGSMGSFTEIYDAHLYPRHHEYHVGSLGT